MCALISNDKQTMPSERRSNLLSTTQPHTHSKWHLVSGHCFTVAERILEAAHTQAHIAVAATALSTGTRKWKQVVLSLRGKEACTGK